MTKHRFNFVERRTDTTTAEKKAFKSWLIDTIKPGDVIEGPRRCDRNSAPPKIFSHWDGGYPRKSDGTRIAPWCIWYINNDFVDNNPYLLTTIKEVDIGVLP